MKPLSAMKKGTKLTDSPKEYMLRVRMDYGTLEKLDIICEIENLSRSEFVREVIEEKFRKIDE